LLVGSDEESSNKDISSYLETHKPPDYSLVLDSNFPVDVGEKAWQALAIASPMHRVNAASSSSKPYDVADLTAGLAPSIVPDRAEVQLVWKDGTPQWQPLIDELKTFKMPDGTRLVTGIADDGSKLRIVAYGVSAHAGVNIEGGRNALVALARAVEGKLPAGGADDLLAFARLAGSDIYGTGLGITDDDPLWGRYAVNVATVKPLENGDRELTINIRRIPPRTGPQLKEMMESFVAHFDETTGAALKVTADSFWGDEPLVFNPKAKIVRRLLADYAAATGEKDPKPAISGGGTYAKRLPSSIAFGMWFPDKPYPGHDVNEKVPIADLMKGTRVLILALADIATGPKMMDAFK
jgi:succinyl-diaminopimelate desuccinylase